MKNIVLILVAILFLIPHPSQCFSKQTETTAKVYNPEDLVELTVVKKDYLIRICKKYLEYPKKWRQIAKINNLKNPNLIYPKERLNIPIELIKGTPLDGKVTFIKGDVQLQELSKEKWVPLKLNDKIKQKSLVKTGEDSAIEITFEDSSTFFLRQNTELGLNTVQKKITSHLIRDMSVQSGRVLTRVREATGAGSRLKIQTPSSIAAVRGTEFRTAVDEEKKAFTEVLNGTVSVDAMMKKISLQKEEGTMVKKGEPPLDPKKLLPPPTPIDPKPQYNPPVKFALSTIQDASAYRVMISKDSEGKDLYQDRIIKSNEAIHINTIPDGQYYLFAQSIDNIGLEGPPSEAFPFVVKKEDPPRPFRASALRKIQYGHYETSFHPQNLGATAFAKHVYDRSKADITVEVFPWGQLGAERSMANQVKHGTLHIAAVAADVLGDYIPELNVLELPFIYPDRATAHKVLDDKEVKEKIETLCNAKGFVFIGYAESELRDLTNSRRPIKTPDDLRGLKIRTMQSPIFIDTFKILGANPTYIPSQEIYYAIQHGMIDGQDNPLSTSMLLKLTDINKYATSLNHILTVRLVVVNKKYWESLSLEQQKIFKEAAEIQAKTIRDENTKLITDTFLKAKTQGVEIHALTAQERDAFKKAVKPILEKYRIICGADWYDFYVNKINYYSGKR